MTRYLIYRTTDAIRHQVHAPQLRRYSYDKMAALLPARPDTLDNIARALESETSGHLSKSLLDPKRVIYQVLKTKWFV